MNTVEINRLVPIYTHETFDKFINRKFGRMIKINLGGEVVYNTAPLSTYRSINLLAISSSSVLLGKGIADITDVIQPHVSLSSVCIAISGFDEHSTNEVFELDVSTLPKTAFYYVTSDNDEIINELTLDFIKKDLIISRHTKQCLDPESKLTPLVKDLCISLDVGLMLKLNITTGELKFQSAYASINDVELKDKLSVIVLGYVLSAYREKKNNNINKDYGKMGKGVLD